MLPAVASAVRPDLTTGDSGETVEQQRAWCRNRTATAILNRPGDLRWPHLLKSWSLLKAQGGSESTVDCHLGETKLDANSWLSEIN